MLLPDSDVHAVYFTQGSGTLLAGAINEISELLNKVF